jgi:arsenate reductase (glutaredoxin)
LRHLTQCAGFDPACRCRADRDRISQNAPSREQLVRLIDEAILKPREGLREKGTPFAELGLDAQGITDDTPIDAMWKYPILINRPFVVTTLGTRLCRPSEVVLDILPPVTRPFAKEDGEVVIDANGKRDL